MKLNNDKIIGSQAKPYFIAEINTSHFGKVDLAKEMILEAKKSGCDCVKFQSWSDDSLYSKDYYVENPIAKRFIKKFSLSKENLIELSIFSKSIGIDFASTPYSNEEVDVLLKFCNVPFIKIASMDINNIPFLKYIAKTGSAVVISTGMADLEEINEAILILKKFGCKNIAILHCVSIYPADYKITNLNNILTFKKLFPDDIIGYSDHTLGIEASVASIALGAKIIEKHFTLDKNIIGMDNQMAVEKDELEKLITSCLNVFQALGSTERIVLEEELEQRLKMRRSLVAKIDIKKGDSLNEKNLDAKRPGNGISVSEFYKILGREIKEDVSKDYLINTNNLK